MLGELPSDITPTKVKDIVSRLERKTDPGQIIGAEMELALLWGINKIAHISVEPPLDIGRSRPDAYSLDLFNRPALIEITAISDDALSGESVMRRISQRICECANGIKKGVGRYLYFEFHEVSFWKGNRYHRIRRARTTFIVDDTLRRQLHGWITSTPLAGACRITNEHVDVTITIRAEKQHPLYNFFSSMPAIPYTLNDNPLHDALKYKEKQIKHRRDGVLGCIFVADAGCRPLRLLTERDPVGLWKSGREIIEYFLANSSVDIVVAFSPHADGIGYFRTLEWRVTGFAADGVDADGTLDRMNELTKTIPRPRFEGYQARALCQQGAFSPQHRGWYLGWQIETGNSRVTMKISARLLHEFMAGRMDREQFARFAFGNNKNLCDLWLSQGLCIVDAAFEKAGVDEDDDYVVLTFAPDPAADKLKSG